MNIKRDKFLSCRVSVDELATIKAKIAAANMTTQEYMIRCLMNHKILNTEGFNEFSALLRRSGVLLNQTLKLYNQGRITDDTELELQRALKEMNEIWQPLKQYLQAKEQ